MAIVTKPMALDESMNTTESTSRNIADVLAQELSGIASAITGGDGKANKTDIATVEPTNTASRAYSVGELVYVNGNLYKVITAIASGATFTVGTNIQSTNVSGTVKDALDELTDEYTVSYYSHSYSIAASGNAYWNPITSDNIEISGYTPIGIISYRTNNGVVYVVNLSVENNGYAIYLHNTSTATVTGNFVYGVLHKKV